MNEPDYSRLGKVKYGDWILLALFAVIGLIVAGVVLAFSAEIPDEPKYVEFPPVKGHYWVVPLRIIDGDSVDFGIVVRVGRGRLPDIDTPEMDTAEGKNAKAKLESILEVGRVTPGRIFGSDKYGTEIDFKGAGGYWAVDTMLKSKHARPWPGGRGPKPFPRKGE